MNRQNVAKEIERLTHLKGLFDSRANWYKTLDNINKTAPTQLALLGRFDVYDQNTRMEARIMIDRGILQQQVINRIQEIEREIRRNGGTIDE